MGPANCVGCKCRKDQEENEVLFTEKNLQFDISQDCINSESVRGNERNKVDNMINRIIPSELFKEDIIELNYESNSKNDHCTMTPKGKDALNDIIEDDIPVVQIENMGKEKENDVNDSNINANKYCHNNNNNNNSNNDQEQDRNAKRKESSFEVNLNNEYLNEDKQDITNNQNELKTYLKSIKPSTSQRFIPKYNHNKINCQEKYENLNFGISKPSELTFEQQKLLFDTQKNLNQFYPPQQNELKSLNSKLKKIPLNSIVPEYKLITNAANNELIFNGDLKKLINYEISAHKPQLYSTRFCTLTKDAFRYYKSKEQYLTLNKPNCTVPLSQITKISLIKTKKTSKKIDHIVICNKLGLFKDRKDLLNYKQFELYDQNAFENNESLLIFTSEIEEFLFKWYLLLNFFLSELNQKEW